MTITFDHDDPERFGWVAVAVDGEWLLDKNGNRRRFKSLEAARQAAVKGR